MEASTTPETSDQLCSIVEGELGSVLRRQLAAWNPDCDQRDIEDALQTACLLAMRKGRAGMVEGEVYAWLRTTAHRWLVDQRRAHGREMLADPTDACFFAGHSGEAPGPESELLAAERDRERRELARSVVSELSPRQRDVLALHSRGRKRPGIAAALGLSQRQVKREIEAIMRSARGTVRRVTGGGCEHGESLVLRRACRLATPTEDELARSHATTCDRCRLLAERLDLWRDVPAILPLPAVVDGDRQGFVVDAVASIRQQVSDALAQAKQQAGALYYRGTDPTPLAGTRPGAIAAVVAGCVTLGTTTYCVDQNVNPLTAIPGLVEAAPQQDASTSPQRTDTSPQPIPLSPDGPATPGEPTPPSTSGSSRTERPPSEPQPAPASGADSLSGLSGSPTSTPAPAPTPPTGSGSGGSSGTTFGGL